MTILTIDPSYAHCAIGLYDGDKTVYADMCSTKLGQNVGFDKTFIASIGIWNQLREKLDRITKENDIVIDKVFSEYPPPVSQYSPGLFALDTYLLNKLFDTYESIKEIYIIPPSYVATLRGSSNKSDSTKLAKYFISEIIQDEISVKIQDSVSESGRKVKGTMNNDKAEAFLFMLRAFCKYDIKGLKDRVECEISGFSKEVEKLLISRK